MCLIAWNEPIGRPNCSRTLAYSTESSRHRAAPPICSAASAAVAEQQPDASIAAALAHAYCSQAFTHAAKECIQIHGGIGYTWEHDAHLYLRRAKSSELFFGPPSVRRARLAELAGI